MAYGGGKDDVGQNWIFNIAIFFFIGVFELSHGPITYLATNM